MKLKILTKHINFIKSTKVVYLISSPNKELSIWFPVKLTFINYDVSTLYVPENKTYYGFDKYGTRLRLTASDIQRTFSAYSNLRNSFVR